MSYNTNFIIQCNKIGKRPYTVTRELGLSNSVVNKWKTGSVPNIETTYKLCKYFGIRIEDLYGYERLK